MYAYMCSMYVCMHASTKICICINVCVNLCMYGTKVAPLDMFKEVNTKTNLPAQIDLYATSGAQYDFQFIAKGM